jgi:oligoribonuclease
MDTDVPKKKTYVSSDFGSKYQYDNDNPWFWIDLETTGLEVETNLILEIVVIVTDSDLNEIDSMKIVLHHPYSVLIARSSTWCRKRFCHANDGGNGLFEACHFSPISHHEAEYRLWNFFDHYSKDINRRSDTRRITTSQPFFERTRGANGTFIGEELSMNHYKHRSNYKKCMLAGSTVYFDRLFLLKYFPCMKTFFHYRLIDVSTPLEMVRRWRPDLSAKLPRRTGTHRAYDDIQESISLMKFFKNNLLSC